MSLLGTFPILLGSQPWRPLADTRAHALDTALRLWRSIHRLQPPGHARLCERAHNRACLHQVVTWGLALYHDVKRCRPRTLLAEVRLHGLQIGGRHLGEEGAILPLPGR